jgi:hypothetical protein
MGISAAAQQLEFIWRTARYIVQQADKKTKDTTDELDAVLRLRESILAQLPPEASRHFTVTEKDIRQLAKQWAIEASRPGGPPVAVASAISLESVGDVLAAKSEDLDDLLHAVMKLLHGYPIRLQLPKDKFGQPDFMDAW